MSGAERWVEPMLAAPAELRMLPPMGYAGHMQQLLPTVLL